MLHGHLIEARYRSMRKSDDFFIDFMQDIRKVYGYIRKKGIVLFSGFMCYYLQVTF